MSVATRRQPATKPDRIDPITVSVIQGALENIAIEMGYKLMRMSYSSIIRESEDFGAALVDAEGRGLAESAQSTPLQSGPIPGYVKGVQRILAERGETIRPGDVMGALGGEAGLTREQVGKITVTDQSTYVAVARDVAPQAVRRLAAGKLKGRTVKVRVLDDAD